MKILYCRTRIIGRKIIDVNRIGKVLVLKLSESKFISIHLKMTGQILYTDDFNHAVFPKTVPFTGGNIMPAKTTRIIFIFSDHSVIFFNDMRKFGWIKLSDKPETPSSPDVLSSGFTYDYLNKLAGNCGQAVKLLLMDQEKISGLGNIYVNDSLWEAKINPFRRSKSLDSKEIKNLYSGIKKIIHESLHNKGSSSSDESYILPSSLRGRYQNHFKVYEREGKPCLRDKTPIKREKQAGRSSYFCPECQK